jgi:hypothetical protein
VSIKIEYDPEGEGLVGRGSYYPVAVCDTCGRRIKDAAMGGYLFELDHDLVERRAVLKGEMVFAHKGACMDVAESRFRTSAFEELTNFPLYFERNMRWVKDYR